MTKDPTFEAIPGAAGREESNSTENSLLLPESSEGGDSETLLWDELERPWPSTYERSISLLASPIQPRKDVEKFTKSPKPGSSPMALARRSDLDRGYHTPVTMRGNKRFDETFKIGVAKANSLDFSKTNEYLDTVSFEQQQKAMQAKAYRESILKKQDIEAGKSKTQKKGAASKKKADAHGPSPGSEKATFSQCTFNLFNILMGVGILGLPYVFKSGGWLGGSVCLFVFSASAWRTAILIGRELNGDPRPCHAFDDSPYKSPLVPGSSLTARMRPPVTSFPDIAREAFGETGCTILSSVLYFELFSCICVLMVAMGDHLHKLFSEISFNMHTSVVATISLVPTVLLKTPALLSYLSMVGSIATVALVVAVIMSYLSEGDITAQVAAKQGLSDDEHFHFAWDPSGLALALGMVSYCFSGHAIVPAIYTTMEKPQEFERMVTFTFIVVTISCFAVAISGYMMFGTLVEEEVTLSLKENSSAQLAMKALTWLMVLTGFSKVTLTMFPLALGMEEIVAPFLSSDFMVAAADSLLKVVLTFLCLLVSLFFPSFSFLVAMVGMVCTMTISIVFPAAAHLKLFGPRLSMVDKIVDWSFIIVGLFMAVVGTIATLPSAY